MTDAPPVLLHSLGGRPAPPELGPALSRIAELSEKTRQALPEIIGSVLDAMPADQVDNRLVRLVRKLGDDPESCAPPIKSSRFLIRSAASMDASVEELRQDVTALCGGQDAVAEMLVPLYEQARSRLRQELVQGALAAHGKVLMGIDWRIDTVGTTNHGVVNLPIALISMHYQNRQSTESITLQMTPDMLSQLRDMCDELLSR